MWKFREEILWEIFGLFSKEVAFERTLGQRSNLALKTLAGGFGQRRCILGIGTNIKDIKTQRQGYDDMPPENVAGVLTDSQVLVSD